MDPVRCADRRDGMNMKQNKKKHMWMGIWFLLAFLLWTAEKLRLPGQIF